MSAEPNHWSFFKLPPFFTKQPAPTALVRQMALWGSLIMDHAAYHALHTQPGVCSFLRLYKSTSDVFHNPSIGRRLPPNEAKEMLKYLASQHPNHCACISDGDDDLHFALLIACNAGGFREIEQSLLSWILDKGAGSTTAYLAQKGVVMTFDELVQGKCLEYRREQDPLKGRLSQDHVPIGDVGKLSEEQAVRTLLQALTSRPASVLRPFSITFFNLDGSSRQPYEGVKFGGSASP